MREAPTIHALKQHAKRLGFSDRELVAVMLGSRGKKSSIIPTSNGSTREVLITFVEGHASCLNDQIKFNDSVTFPICVY